MTFIARNTDDHRRTWPALRTIDGRVLVLDPGQEDELADNPGEVAHLKVRAAKPPKTDNADGGK